jgi:hypothetical protein
VLGSKLPSSIDRSRTLGDNGSEVWLLADVELPAQFVAGVDQWRASRQVQPSQVKSQVESSPLHGSWQIWISGAHQVKSSQAKSQVK